MDALSLNIRVSTEPSSLPDSRALAVPVAEQNLAVPSVATAVKTEQALHKQSSGVNARDISADIKGAMSNANHFFQQVNRELRFQRSETDGKMVVQVFDQKTGEVIRQFPSEEMLKISKDLEKISGLLFRDSA